MEYRDPADFPMFSDDLQFFDTGNDPPENLLMPIPSPITMDEFFSDYNKFSDDQLFDGLADFNLDDLPLGEPVLNDVMLTPFSYTEESEDGYKSLDYGVLSKSPEYFNMSRLVGNWSEDELLPSQPITSESTTNEINFTETPSKPTVELKEHHECNWLQDHDYVKSWFWTKTKRDLEPQVEVWEIENFEISDNEQAQQVPVCAQVPSKNRRTSTRAAHMRQKNANKLLNCGVFAAFENQRIPSKRPKTIKPKNSVETSPSQSDIEECYSQPLKYNVTVRKNRSAKNSRPARNTRPENRITKAKKKTSKGRIDHSESERLRREVMREHFAALSQGIPTNYLRGEKPSAQVSKQKILNGAKAFVENLLLTKVSYKDLKGASKAHKEQIIKLHHLARTQLSKLRLYFK